MSSNFRLLKPFCSSAPARNVAQSKVSGNLASLRASEPRLSGVPRFPYSRRNAGTQRAKRVRMGRPFVDGNRVAVEWWTMMVDEGESVTLPGCLLRFEATAAAMTCAGTGTSSRGRASRSPAGVRKTWGRYGSSSRIEQPKSRADST
jgi:hypothetical protein